MNSKMWIGVGISCVWMAMILAAQAMRNAKEPNTYRYTIASESVLATVTVYAPRELSETDELLLRSAACGTIYRALEVGISESGT